MENENLSPQRNTSSNSEQLSHELQDIIPNNSNRPEKLTEKLNASEWINHISTNLNTDREHNKPIDGNTVRSLVIDNIRSMPESDQRIALLTAFSAIIAQPNLVPGMKEQLSRDINRISNGDDISDLVGKKM